MLQCTMHSCDPPSYYWLAYIRLGNWDKGLKYVAVHVQKLGKTTPWPAYSPGKLYITLHDGDAFGMYSTEISRERSASGNKGNKGKTRKPRTHPRRDGRGRPPLPPARPRWRNSASAGRSHPSDSWCRSSYPVRSREPVCWPEMSGRGGGRHGMAAYDARERKSAEEEIGAALVLANLAECEGAGAIAAFLALSRLLVGV